MNLYYEIMSNIKVEGLSKLEVARLLYIELAKRVSFSQKFQNTTDLEMAKMMRGKINIDTFDKREVNCYEWAHLYNQLLERNGIDNEVINLGHRYVEFYLDGKRYVADATHGDYTDLSRIHNSDNTEYFGLSIYQDRPDKYYNAPRYDLEFIEKLKRIDNKLGYNDEKHKDLVELKELIKRIASGSLDLDSFIPGEGNIVDKKLQLLFAKCGVLDFGYYESKDYLYNLERLLLTEDELKEVHARELKRTNKDGSVDIIQIIATNNNYYILVPNEPIRNIDRIDVENLAVLGFGLDEGKTIPGINFPSKFTPGKVIKGVKSVKFNMKKRIELMNNKLLREVEHGLTSHAG